MDACLFTAFFRTGFGVTGWATLNGAVLGEAMFWVEAVETVEVATAGLLFSLEHPTVSSKAINDPATTSLPRCAAAP
jgi:hypothetical protein